MMGALSGKRPSDPLQAKVTILLSHWQRPARSGSDLFPPARDESVRVPHNLQTAQALLCWLALWPWYLIAADGCNHCRCVQSRWNRFDLVRASIPLTAALITASHKTLDPIKNLKLKYMTYLLDDVISND